MLVSNQRPLPCESGACWFVIVSPLSDFGIPRPNYSVPSSWTSAIVRTGCRQTVVRPSLAQASDSAVPLFTRGVRGSMEFYELRLSRIFGSTFAGLLRKLTSLRVCENWRNSFIRRWVLGDYLLRPIVPQTGFPGADDCLRPIRYLQLEEDVRDVVPHRLESYEQLPGYLLIAPSLCHEGEGLLFALGELRENELHHGRLWCREAPHDALGYTRPEDDFSACHRSNGMNYPLTSGVLSEVAFGPGAHRSENRIVVLEHGKHQHTNMWDCAHDLAGSLYTV